MSEDCPWSNLRNLNGAFPFSGSTDPWRISVKVYGSRKSPCEAWNRGLLYNTATGQYFLATLALVGYIEGRNDHLIEFMIAVNNGTMPKINDIFPIFEDFGK